MTFSNKRALTQVVLVVIFIALALVLAGIVWAVIDNLVNTQTTNTDLSGRCFNAAIEIEDVTCGSKSVENGANDDGTPIYETVYHCNVTVARESGSEVIDGVKVVIGQYSKEYDSQIEPLERVIVTVDTADTDYNDVEGGKVIASAYFEDANSGRNYYCTALDEYYI